MIHSRRGFLTGLVGLVAAPAVCRADWLMPVKAIIKPVPLIWRNEAITAELIAREALKILENSLVMERLILRSPFDGMVKGDTITIRRPLDFAA